jgi:hypothetical protein
MISARSSALFLRRERFCEQAGALPAAPRHVVAGDRVMMGAAAAG